MSDISPVGDVELFVVSGEDGSWSLPIYATPYVAGNPELELYLVTPALPLMKNPSDALLSVLLPAMYSKREGVMEFWFLRSALRAVAKKAEGVTPKFYMKWGNERDIGRTTEASVEFHEQEEIDDEQMKFLRFIVNQTALLNMAQARIFWKAFTQCGAEWLGRFKKPLICGDLFTVTPLPYRRNWKERVYEMMSERVYDRVPRIFIHAMKKSRPERDRFVRDEMAGEFFNTTLMDVDYARHYVHWNLEFTVGAKYKKFASDVEAEVLHSRGRPQYARKIIREIQARLPAILDALSAWIKEIGRPCGGVEQKRLDRGPCIIPLKKPGQILPLAPRHPIVPVVVDGEPQITGPSFGAKLEATVKVGLREMYALQLTEGDVRNAGKGNGAPNHEGVAAASGVSLLCPIKKPDPGVEVLDGDGHEQRD